MDIDFKKELEFIKKELNDNLESLVLFGSYARGEQIKTSDIDLLIIINEKINEISFEKKIQELNLKFSLLILTKDEFKNRLLDFNHQLLTLFYDGKVLFDINKFFYKMENLYLALYRKKDFTLKFRKRIISLKKLRQLKSYI